MNSYCDKLLQGQSTLLQNVMEQQINSQSEMFHREMEMQRNWEQNMLEREMEFQREQTAAMIQSFNESIRSLRPVGPTYTPLKLIPVRYFWQLSLISYLYIFLDEKTRGSIKPK